MKLTCPKNNRHRRFSVTAHVTQEWKVDRDGEYLKTLNDCQEVIHHPDTDDMFICLACGAEALAED